MNRNIKYRSKQLLELYKSHRQKWDEFYPSEKRVFERIAGYNGGLGDVLDVGCACGGLGSALSGKFKMNSYTGIDINNEAIAWAKKERKLPVPSKFIAKDIIELKSKKKYDTVFSLSCADWNVETGKIIDACWDRVKRGGYLVISLRLSPEKGVNNVKTSYQIIGSPGCGDDTLIANYVVLSPKEVRRTIRRLSPPPDFVGSYGYWGKPSPTAHTPFDKLIFSVFYIKKGRNGSGESGKIDSELDLPLAVSLC